MLAYLNNLVSNLAPEWWLIGVTGLLVVVTAGLWRATRNLVKGAEKTAERQLRAYVMAKAGTILHEKRPRGWWLEWHPEFSNVGQTPAYNVRSATMADIRPDPLPPGTDLISELTVTGTGSQTTMGTGQSIWPVCHPNRYLSDSELKTLKSRYSGSAFYVWGLITYRDIFKNEHRTVFCNVADWDTAGNPISRCAPQHNEAD